MKVVICGAPGSGKSDLVSEILDIWPMFTSANRLGHVECSKEARNSLDLITSVIDDRVIEANIVGDDENVVYDGGLLDSLAHLFTFMATHPDEDQSIIRKYVQKVHNALSSYGVIFYIPFNSEYSGCDKESFDKEDLEYSQTIDHFLASFQSQWKSGVPGIFPFEHRNGSPSMIDIIGSRDQRVAMLQMYIKENGELYGADPKDSLLNFSPSILDANGDKIT